MMYGLEKSDSAIRAMKPAHKAGRPAAEWAEQRAGTKGNAGHRTRDGLRAAVADGPHCARASAAVADRKPLVVLSGESDEDSQLLAHNGMKAGDSAGFRSPPDLLGAGLHFGFLETWLDSKTHRYGGSFEGLLVIERGQNAYGKLRGSAPLSCHQIAFTPQH